MFSIRRKLTFVSASGDDHAHDAFVDIELTPDEILGAHREQLKVFLRQEAERQLGKVLDRDLGYSPDTIKVMFPDAAHKEQFLDWAATLFRVRTDENPAYESTPNAEADIWRIVLLDTIDVLLVPSYADYLAKLGVEVKMTRKEILWAMAERHWFKGDTTTGAKREERPLSLREAAESAYKDFLLVTGGYDGRVEDLFPDANTRLKLLGLTPRQFAETMLPDEKVREQFFACAIDAFKKWMEFWTELGDAQPSDTDTAANWRCAIKLAHNDVLYAVYAKRLRNYGIQNLPDSDNATGDDTARAMKMLAAHGWL